MNVAAISEKDVSDAQRMAKAICEKEWRFHGDYEAAMHRISAKRGRSMRKASVDALIIDNRREHSRKPEIFRDRVRKYVGPDVDVLELFARSKPQDQRWNVWGNETQKFEAVA